MSRVVATKEPSLRFQKFSGVWKEKKFSEIARIIRGASPRPRSDPRYYGGNVPRLMVEDVARDGKYVVPKTDSLTEEGAKLSRWCKAGTLTIVCSGTAKTVGQPSFLTVDACIHDGFLAMVDIAADISADFTYLQIERLRSRSESAATHGGTFINLTTDILRNFSRSFPPLPEQQKIAEFLGAVDDRIKLLQRRRDALARYKTGLMQRLFDQSLRFTRDDGTAFPDWKTSRLGQLGEFLGGGTPDTNIDEFWTGDIPWVSSSDIFENSIHHISLTRKITEEALVASATKKVPAGSILIVTRVGVGKIAISPVELCTSQDFSNFILRDDSVQFVAYWLAFNQTKLLSLSQGTSIKGITTVDLKGLKISLPHVDEQRKIANFLGLVDNKITAVAAQIAQMQSFKKGLLQQMFV